MRPIGWLMLGTFLAFASPMSALAGDGGQLAGTGVWADVQDDPYDFKEYSAFQQLSETADFPEIKALEANLLEQAHRLYTYGELSREITPSDIDYNRAVKIYMDGAEPAFDDSLESPEHFRAFLENAEYIWVLQVDLGSQTVTYTFDLGKPVQDDIRSLLSPEQIAEAERQAGHWRLVNTTWGQEAGESYRSYIKRALEQEQLDREASVVIIGGTPELRYPAAVLYGPEGVKIIPADPTANKRMKALLTNSRGSSGADSGIGDCSDDRIAVCDGEAYRTALRNTRGGAE